jgi:hexosaminidase
MNPMKVQKAILLAAMILFSAAVKSQKPAIIPQPAEISAGDGKFEITSQTCLKFDGANKDLKRIAGFLNDHLRKYYNLSLNPADRSNDVIQLKLAPSEGLGKEGYKLNVGKNGIVITASAPNGIFYGIQSLKQLLPVGTAAAPFPVPYVEIKDLPRFSWRGLHLDCGRHFFPVSCIKDYIDHMALYKLNTFHWHLTEDQGWRLEIKKYPKLTEIGSWRDETIVDTKAQKYDGIGYGGFYTQDQVKEIVKYAAERFITIIPEIEMPGHSSAALASYPELGCTGGPYHVAQKWGIFEDVFCAGKEETFKFMEGVIDEVCRMFPSQYIHIGGDECPKASWKKCPLCQQRIKDQGLKDENELQSYFIRRMEKYLVSKGKKLIGWEEILEGGLAPEATVMAWKRNTPAGSIAAKQQHDVIRCPATHCYLNYYQVKDIANEPPGYPGWLSLEKVYSFEPIPDDLKKEDWHYIIGAQACVWSEFISTTGNLEYTLFPRICAMAEVVWSPAEKKDFNGFKERLGTEFLRMKMYKINYCDHPY